MADVQPEPIRWLWPSWIPLGMLTVFDGDPGLGKSTVTIDLASRLSRGAAMPDGSPGPPTAAAVILSAEDDLARVIRPRLDAANADVARVMTLEIEEGHDRREPAICPRDLSAVESAVAQTGALLVVVDPLMAYLPADINAHRDQDVRRSLSMLRGLAERTGAAVVVIRHLNKTLGINPIHRGGGSIGIIGAARAGIMVAADPDDPSGKARVLAVTKSNLARCPGSLRFRLVPDPGSAHPSVRWDGDSEHTPATLLAAPADPKQKDREEARKRESRAKANRLDRARGALRDRIAQWAADRDPMRKNEDAVPFLLSLGVPRDDARELIRGGLEKDWLLSGGGRRGDPEVLLPVSPQVPPQETAGGELAVLGRTFESWIPAEAANGGPQETLSSEPVANGPECVSGHPREDLGSALAPCPDCGGRVLHWTAESICTSCHRRFSTGDNQARPRALPTPDGWAGLKNKESSADRPTPQPGQP